MGYQADPLPWPQYWYGPPSTRNWTQLASRGRSVRHSVKYVESMTEKSSGGGGGLPLCDIVRMCVPNSRHFQRRQVYDEPPFKKRYMNGPNF